MIAAFRRLALACLVASGMTQGPTACKSFLQNWDEVNNPDDDSALARCRKLGREEREAGATPEAAYEAYVDCTREAGLR